jgi:hypothetical protein
MFATLVGIFGNLCSGICLSVVSLMLFRLFLRTSAGSRSSWFRRMVRGSYYFYASILGWLRPYVAQILPLDLLSPVPRTLAAIGLSIGFGWGVLTLLGLHMPTWLIILLLLHGLFVGWSWEHTTLPDDFHLGMRLE